MPPRNGALVGKQMYCNVAWNSRSHRTTAPVLAPVSWPSFLRFSFDQHNFVPASHRDLSVADGIGDDFAEGVNDYSRLELEQTSRENCLTLRASSCEKMTHLDGIVHSVTPGVPPLKINYVPETGTGLVCGLQNWTTYAVKAVIHCPFIKAFSRQDVTVPGDGEDE